MTLAAAAGSSLSKASLLSIAEPEKDTFQGADILVI